MCNQCIISVFCLFSPPAVPSKGMSSTRRGPFPTRYTYLCFHMLFNPSCHSFIPTPSCCPLFQLNTKGPNLEPWGTPSTSPLLIYPVIKNWKVCLPKVSITYKCYQLHPFTQCPYQVWHNAMSDKTWGFHLNLSFCLYWPQRVICIPT